MTGFEEHIRNSLGIWESPEAIVEVSISSPEQVQELIHAHPDIVSVDFAATISWRYTNPRRGSSFSVFAIDNTAPGILFTTGVKVPVPPHLQRYTEPLKLRWEGDATVISWQSDDGVLYESCRLLGEDQRQRILRFDVFQKEIVERRTSDHRVSL